MKTMFSNDCPYACNNGKIYNPALRRLVDCPHCSEIRREQVRKDDSGIDNKSLSESFNVKKSVIGLEFSMSTIIPEYSRKFLVPSSVDKVEESLIRITNKALLGEKPDTSLLYNLGDGGNIDAFAYQYMMKAYKNGLSVAPLLSAKDILRMRLDEEDSIGREVSETFIYSDLLSKDICIVFFDAGATHREVDAIKGLMQLRARNDLPTIIFTLSSYSKYMIKLSVDANVEGYQKAKLVSVEYIKFEDSEYPNSQSSHSSSIGKMTSEEFDRMFESRDTL